MDDIQQICFTFYRYKEDSTTKHLGDVDEVIGCFTDGKLTGRSKIKFKDKRLLIGYFTEGVLHGFARYILHDITKIRQNVSFYRFFDKKGRLTLAGQYRNGNIVGTAWKIIRGGGCVVGQVFFYFKKII